MEAVFKKKSQKLCLQWIIKLLLGSVKLRFQLFDRERYLHLFQRSGFSDPEDLWWSLQVFTLLPVFLLTCGFFWKMCNSTAADLSGRVENAFGRSWMAPTCRQSRYNSIVLDSCCRPLSHKMTAWGFPSAGWMLLKITEFNLPSLFR